jgi:beta-glucosidase
VAPAFPFGFGLSYTKFRYERLGLEGKTPGRSGSVTVRVEVKNVGERAGEEVVQIYVGFRGSRVDRPVRELRGFGRLSLEPGETGTLQRTIPVSSLAFYDVNVRRWEVEEIEYDVYAGPSSGPGDLTLRDSFRVQGP